MKEEKKIFVTKATLPPKEEFLKYVRYGRVPGLPIWVMYTMSLRIL